MLVLHVHWSQPRASGIEGKVVLWAETSEVELPRRGGPAASGSLPKKWVPKEHPYCAERAVLREVMQQAGHDDEIVLRLPTTRRGPLPSPRLPHTWELDQEPAVLLPWKIRGISFSGKEAFLLVLNLNGLRAKQSSAAPALLLADEAVFWERAAALVLETLASQKLIPVAAAVPERQTWQARWLPVLDSTRDAQRLRLLESALPPVCRAEWVEPLGRKTAPLNWSAGTPSARAVLESFLRSFSDCLARQWGRDARLRLNGLEEGPARRWLLALFSQDAELQGSLAQLRAFVNSHRAWMRQLYTAGDAAFRIAFRLEDPSAAEEAENEHVIEAVSQAQPDWKLHYFLQARDDPSLLVPAQAAWESRGSILTLLNHRFEEPQEKLLAGLGYAARLFAPIHASLKNKAPTVLPMDSQQAYRFLREAAPLLEEAGFGVLVPPWWNQAGTRLGVRLRLNARPQTAAASSGLLSLNNLVSYQWELTLGETKLSEKEFRALARLKTPLLRLRGRWVQLDPEQIEAAIRFWENKQFKGEMSLLDAAQYALGADTTQEALPIDDIQTEGWLSDWMQHLEQPARLEELPQPLSLAGSLRPYQRYGYSWLHFHKSWGLGACLADDMGLGKTIQTIALLLKEKEAAGSLPAPALLVCPTSVVPNWERELERFAPLLKVHIHQGARRLRNEEFLEEVLQVDVVLTSYPLVRQDGELLQKVGWYGVILDEAQNIKNPSAQQTQALRKLRGDFRLALTGTPVENRLSELWSIMHFLNPGYLGTQKEFRREFSQPIERDNSKDAALRLRQLVSPFILRRVKSDPSVIQDLPEKVETRVYCSLTEEQATLYEAVVQDVIQQIEEKEGMQRRGLVLSMLMQLKQICNHPSHYLHQEKEPAHTFAGRSGKLERLDALLEEVVSAGDRALIFTQFAEMGGVLEKYLSQVSGVSAQFLHGGIPLKRRELMVDRFQNEEHAPSVFILSIKAGGTGLNLTRASHVFHFDRWWNPAVEDQATDRAFRIGQKQNVQVHKFVCMGTLEEKIDELIESKKGLAQSIVGSGESWLTELSTGELRDLVQLRRRS